MPKPPALVRRLAERANEARNANAVSTLHEPRVCKCGHFDYVHAGLKACPCGCQQFEEIPFDESELGKALSAWMESTSHD